MITEDTKNKLGYAAEFDEEGLKSPKKPLSWESLARVVVDEYNHLINKENKELREIVRAFCDASKGEVDKEMIRLARTRVIQSEFVNLD